jgi:hypothetical protein
VKGFDNSKAAPGERRLQDPQSRKIGDSPIMLADEFPGIGARNPQSLAGSPVSILLYVNDVDAVFTQAVAAGATVQRPVADQFYGDRTGGVTDLFGHVWYIATHKEDVSPEEMKKRAAAAGRGRNSSFAFSSSKEHQGSDLLSRLPSRPC